MITRTLSRWWLSIALAAFALAAINLLMTIAPTQAHRAALTNCAGSIQACIDAAPDGDTILIAAGRYTESLTLSKPVSLTGENCDTTIIHAKAGQRVLTVTGATIDNSVVISGLTFTGGAVYTSWECPEFCGGGIAILNSAQPNILNVTINDNRAADGGGIYAEPGSSLYIANSQLISNNADHGGGIYVGQWYVPGNLAVTNTKFLSNAAFDGGGIYINGIASLTDVYFDSNMANSLASGLGGGLYATIGTIAVTRTVFINNEGTAFYTSNSPATISDSRFESNSGSIGGGLWAYQVGANISHTTFISNTAELGGGGVTMIDGSIVNSRFEGNTVQQYWGGGLYAMGMTLVTNTVFINNIAQTNGGGAYFGNAEIYASRFEGNIGHMGAGGGFFAFGLLLNNTDVISNFSGCSSWTSGCGGGGVYAFNKTTIQNSRFEGNISTDGGGLYANDAVTVTSSVFISNTAQQQGGGGFFGSQVLINNTQFVSNHAGCMNWKCGGGGLFANDFVTITNASFIGNTTLQFGGGAIISGTGALLDVNFISNTAQQGGGGVYLAGPATIFGGRFEGNQAVNSDGGGMLSNSNPLQLTGTKFVRNSATNFAGGGLTYSSGHARIINTLFAGNSANILGAALTIHSGAEVELLNSTITDPASNLKWAITSINSALHVTNTVISSHTLGIAGTYQMTTEDYNLFYGNLTNAIGVTSGGHSLVGDPKFVDPVSGDYHLQFGSAAIDHGVDAGIYIDLDGKPRPVGAGFDIGAYEYQAIKVVYLPIIRR